MICVEDLTANVNSGESQRLTPPSMELKIRTLIKQLASQSPRLFENRLNVIRPRGKRGFVNAVGDLSKTLFGTATQDDVNQLHEKVNEIIARISFSNTHFGG